MSDGFAEWVDLPGWPSRTRIRLRAKNFSGPPWNVPPQTTVETCPPSNRRRSLVELGIHGGRRVERNPEFPGLADIHVEIVV